MKKYDGIVTVDDCLQFVAKTPEEWYQLAGCYWSRHYPYIYKIETDIGIYIGKSAETSSRLLDRYRCYYNKKQYKSDLSPRQLFDYIIRQQPFKTSIVKIRTDPEEFQFIDLDEHKIIKEYKGNTSLLNQNIHLDIPYISDELVDNLLSIDNYNHMTNGCWYPKMVILT